MESLKEDLGDFTPLRNYADFCSTNRFQAPDWNNSERLANRIMSNLIYYQTNYFLLMAVIFASFFLSCPHSIISSIILLALIGIISMRVGSPNYNLVIAAGVAFIGMTFLRQFLWFLLSLAVPLAIVILHAAMRMRNVKNKAENLKEVLGVKKKNPMSYILKLIGFTHQEFVFN
uniref:PRA1 family protein n=2 Tax=Caligus rogercresseyi TaxID=217165 RepID=C1BPW2_CALRO|nr:PRA1 family protein 3 [Caligus rogercresseyi]|eukprot:TRINITY_DN14954_c0_g1_i1.p1 TRINITY_DN14954_c0_g1~~TRINITY_DN14954_c0_g1_i1.p1  ORF type:complete len:174 (+),score=53.72 TRINITY_DN14954_c0_g1_i1:148-669(+)